MRPTTTPPGGISTEGERYTTRMSTEPTTDDKTIYVHPPENECNSALKLTAYSSIILLVAHIIHV